MPIVFDLLSGRVNDPLLISGVCDADSHFDRSLVLVLPPTALGHAVEAPHA